MANAIAGALGKKVFSACCRELEDSPKKIEKLFEDSRKGNLFSFNIF